MQIKGQYRLEIQGTGLRVPWWDEETKKAADDYFLAILNTSSKWPTYERRIVVEVDIFHS